MIERLRRWLSMPSFGVSFHFLGPCQAPYIYQASTLGAAFRADMEAVRRLFRLAGQLQGAASRPEEAPPVPKVPQDVIEQLRDLWCVPWRPVQSPALLVATSDLLGRLYASRDGRPGGESGGPEEVQLLVRIVHISSNLLLQTPPSPFLSVPDASPSSDLRWPLSRVVESALMLLVAWAADLPSRNDARGGMDGALIKDCLTGAAVAATDAATSAPLSSLLSPTTVEVASSLWVHAGRTHTCEPGLVLRRLSSLWSLPHTLCKMLDSRERAVRSLRGLVDILPSSSSDADLQYAVTRLAITCFGVGHGQSLDTLEALAMALRGSLTSSPQRTMQAGRAVLDLMAPGCKSIEGGTATVAAVALLGQQQDRREDGHLEEAGAGLLRRVVGISGEVMGLQAKRSAQEWTARAALSVALTNLSGVGLNATMIRPDGFNPRDVSICLAALLRLALEDVVEGTSSLIEEVADRWVTKSDRLASAVVAFYQRSDAPGKAQALSTVRAFAETMATGTTDQWSPERGGHTINGDSRHRRKALLLLLQICAMLVSSARPCITSSDEATWVMDALSYLAALAIETPLEGRVYQCLDSLRQLLESQPDDSMMTVVRDHVLRQWKEEDGHHEEDRGASRGPLAPRSTPNPVLDDRRHEHRQAFLLRAASATCLESRRPATYMAVSDVVRRLLAAIPAHSPGSRVSQDAHLRLRSIVANPRILAYRAGPSAHWDEARRRVLVTYVQVALATFPDRTSDQDLAYCVGSAIGGLSHDVPGQRVLLSCLTLLANRAHELWRADPDCQQGSTAAITKLLFQTLVLCPTRALPAGLACTADFIEALGSERSRRHALLLLRDTIGGDSESTRQTELAKWYLVLANALSSSSSRGPGAAAK